MDRLYHVTEHAQLSLCSSSSLYFPRKCMIDKSINTEIVTIYLALRGHFTSTIYVLLWSPWQPCNRQWLITWSAISYRKSFWQRSIYLIAEHKVISLEIYCRIVVVLTRYTLAHFMTTCPEWSTSPLFWCSHWTVNLTAVCSLWLVAGPLTICTKKRVLVWAGVPIVYCW